MYTLVWTNLNMWTWLSLFWAARENCRLLQLWNVGRFFKLSSHCSCALFLPILVLVSHSQTLSESLATWDYIGAVLHTEPFASSSSGLTAARYSTTVLLEENVAELRERHCCTLAEQSYKRHSLVSFILPYSMLQSVYGECNNHILYAVWPRLWQEKSFRTPDPLPAFREWVITLA